MKRVANSSRFVAGRDGRAGFPSPLGSSGTTKIRSLVLLARPHQWTKNVLVFAALVFAQRLFEPESVVRSAIAFAAFCVLSSAAYVVNDLRDRGKDRLHPEKRLRPLASGAVGTIEAIAFAILLAAGAILLAAWLTPHFLVVLGAYAVLQVAYSFGLKEVAVVDVMGLAGGFVLRATAGGVAIAVEISPWLIICTFLLALFLGFAKRRHEVTVLEDKAALHRTSLQDYSPYFLDQMIAVVTASTVVAYAIYTVSPEVQGRLGTQHLYLTLPFVLFGIFRYLYLVHQRNEGGNPTRVLLTDRALYLNGILWFATVLWLLYF